MDRSADDAGTAHAPALAVGLPTLELEGATLEAYVAPMSSDLAIQRRALEHARLNVVRTWETRRRGVHRALHDGAQQGLLGLRLSLLRDSDPSERIRKNHSDRLDEIIAQLQRLALGLPPDAARFDDISDALHQIASQSGMPVHVDAPAGLRTSMVVAELIVFTASESLANILKHSGATQCWLQLTTKQETLTLTIRDDGNGQGQQQEGRGLSGLRSRAASLGGELSIQTEAHGTVVELTVPDLPAELDVAPASDKATPPWHHPTRDTLRNILNDPDADIQYEVKPGLFCDERGVALHNATLPRALVGFVLQPGLVAILSASATISETKVIASEYASTLIQGWQRACAATELASLVAERSQCTRRSDAFEAALARRLTRRPVELILAAQQIVNSAGCSLERAADILLQATEVLRGIATALGANDTALITGDSSNDPFLLRLLGDSEGVEVDARVQDLPSGDALAAFASMGEAVVSDAEVGDSITIRVSRNGRHAQMFATLERLPSPSTLAFIEDVVTWLGGSVTCTPDEDRVRVRIETPCVSL